MRRLVTLLAVLLLAPVFGPGAAADDVRVGAWQRLLAPPGERRRPCLGLLAFGAWRLADAVVEPGPYEQPDGEERGSDGQVAWPAAWDVAWLLSWGHGGDVAAALLRRIAVDAEVRTPDGHVHRARLVAVPGRRASLTRTRTLRVVADYDVELACDNSGGLRPSAVGDPQLRSLLDGLALDVRPFAVGGDRIALEVVFQAGRFDRPVDRFDTRALYLGEVDLPRYRGAVLSASGAVASGSALDLSVQGEGGEGFAVRLTPRLVNVPESDDRARVHPLDARFLLAPRAAIGFDRQPDPYANPPACVSPAATWVDPLLDRGTLWEHIDRLLPSAELRFLPHGDVWVVADEDAVAEVGRTFTRWATQAARTVCVELVARTGDTVLGRADLPVLTGRSAFFRLGVDRAVVLDPDVEVG